MHYKFCNIMLYCNLYVCIITVCWLQNSAYGSACLSNAKLRKATSHDRNTMHTKHMSEPHKRPLQRNNSSLYMHTLPAQLKNWPQRGCSGVPFINTMTAAELTSDLRRSLRLWHYTDIIHCVSKNVPSLTGYSYNTHPPIFIIFRTSFFFQQTLENRLQV